MFVSSHLFAGMALATDGVLEINQTCATSTGCFSADPAGFPVTIGSAGSYRLTSNLTVPDRFTDGIVVNAPDVHIDLNGFTIAGPVSCTGTPTTCDPLGGSGSGVEAGGGTPGGTSLSNGTISGMGRYGALLGDAARVDDVRFFSNAVDGLFTGNASAASNVIAERNGADGVDVSNTSIAVNVIAQLNGDEGVEVGTRSTISNCRAVGNGRHGIQGSVDSMVSDTIAAGNTGFGFFLNATSVYRDNVVNSNVGGSVNTGIDAGGNFCGGTAGCP